MIIYFIGNPQNHDSDNFAASIGKPSKHPDTIRLFDLT
jgi:hypothetical protein